MLTPSSDSSSELSAGGSCSAGGVASADAWGPNDTRMSGEFLPSLPMRNDLPSGCDRDALALLDLGNLQEPDLGPVLGVEQVHRLPGADQRLGAVRREGAVRDVPGNVLAEVGGAVVAVLASACAAARTAFRSSSSACWPGTCRRSPGAPGTPRCRRRRRRTRPGSACRSPSGRPGRARGRRTERCRRAPRRCHRGRPPTSSRRRRWRSTPCPRSFPRRLGWCRRPRRWRS